MGNHVVAGRDLTWHDAHTSAPVALISDNLAREYWGEPAKAIGRRIRRSPQSPWTEIVGVVGNERQDGATQPAPTMVYWPMMTGGYSGDVKSINISARSPTPFARRGCSRRASCGEVQQAVWSVNPNLPLARVRTLQQIYDESMAQTSFVLVILGIAAAVTLLLGVVGIYGVIAYIVSQRRREIGIRMALGARSGEVQRMFIGRGVALAGDRPGRRPGVGSHADAPAELAVVRRQPVRPAHLRRGRRRPGGGRAGRHVAPGPPAPRRWTRCPRSARTDRGSGIGAQGLKLGAWGLRLDA